MASIFSSLMPLLQGFSGDISGDDIPVTGRKAAPRQEIDAAPASLGNRSFIEEALQAQANSPQRKGMFGVKGTLRDVLGTIGDAFLVQSGNKQMYAPRRDQERMGDALAGFTQDPMAALERLATLPGGAEMAQKFYDDISQNQIRSKTAEMTGQKNQQEGFKEGSRLFGQYAGAIARNPKLAPVLGPVMQQVKQMYQLGDDFVIPGEQETDVAEGFQYGGTPTQAQIADDRKIEAEQGRNTRFDKGQAGQDRRTAIKEAGADRRDNPPSIPQPTRASIAAPLLRKLEKGGKLTPQEQQVLDRVAPAPRGGRRGPPAGLPPGFSKPKKVN